MQPHRSNALDGAAAALSFDSGTHARVLWPVHHRPLSSVMVLWSWSHQPHDSAGPRVSGCMCIRDPASGLRDTLNSQLWRQLWAARASRRCIAWPNPASPMPKGVKLTEGE
jgi:hypothetical protein